MVICGYGEFLRGEEFNRKSARLGGATQEVGKLLPFRHRSGIKSEGWIRPRLSLSSRAWELAVQAACAREAKAVVLKEESINLQSAFSS